jgi:hypothetical protein
VEVFRKAALNLQARRSQMQRPTKSQRPELEFLLPVVA